MLQAENSECAAEPSRLPSVLVAGVVTKLEKAARRKQGVGYHAEFREI
jgi:hypothetical protein